MASDVLEHDPQLAREFERLEEALMTPTFSVKEFEPEFIAFWVNIQYEGVVERMERSWEQLHDKEDEQVVWERVEGNLWYKHLNHCLELCRSTKAKRAVWVGIAKSMMTQSNGPILKKGSLFLQENVQWAPKSAHKEQMGMFAGTFSSGFYTPQSLVAAAHWMQQGHEAGGKHIRDWLIDTSLAPGVLPVRKYGTSAALSVDKWKAEVRRNANSAMLWRDVVLPYCQTHPQDALRSDKVFFYLPLVQTSKTLYSTIAFVNALPSEHQKQWLYANIVPGDSQIAGMYNDFWRDALLVDVSPKTRDLRLYLAMCFLSGSDGVILAREMDPAITAMLDGLGTTNRDTLREVLYARWMDHTPAALALPTDWYDDENTTLGL